MINEKQDRGDGMLSPFRVLDLTDEKGLLCGKILASMGAEVIKIEPPGGDKARNIPPFFKDIVHPEQSLFYMAYNTNKKSITLDIESSDGQMLFKKLVASSDFVIESYEPGYLDKLGLSYKDLSSVNPRIILTSISPLGQKGPYSHYKSSDLMCVAMSGFLYLTGDIDRPPVRISVPQAYSMGAAEAAGASMIAHYYRQITGEGQQVDVSIRDSLIKTTVNTIYWWEQNKIIIKRTGPYWGLRGEPIRVLWRCKDGWTSFALHGSKFGAKTNYQLVEWADSEGLADDTMRNVKWESLDMETVDRNLIAHLEASVERFFLTHTTREVMEGALKRGIMMLPVQTIEDVVKSPQLRDREYWDVVKHPELSANVVYPGAFVKASETPCVRSIRAPLIGEHNEEIYMSELGMSREQIIVLKAARII
jgi:crotonobetainyl-CoA:carnitine CoA-transferase CaiB-like acyl-CoA transferase